MRKLSYLFAALLVLSLVIAACSTIETAEPVGEVEMDDPTEEALVEDAADTDDAATAGDVAAGDMQFTTVVKIAGINWFNRMEEGVQAFADESGVNAVLVGPAEADAAQQIPIIEDLIAQNVDGLCVIPMDPAQLDPVLAQAMEAGITVVTHEAPSQINMDYDIEAFDNFAFGAGLMDRLAEEMGEEGEYAVFVGSLGSETHNAWVDGAIARQEEAYPNMTLVGDKYETFDDAQTAYERAQEVLRAFPDIKGMQGSASTDVAGIGQAIEEAGLEDEVAVVGTSLPSIAGDLLQTGAIDAIGFWDPAVAGEACNKLIQMQLNGEEIGEGTNLGIEGYENLTVSGENGNVLTGNAPVYVDAETAGDYPF